MFDPTTEYNTSQTHPIVARVLALAGLGILAVASLLAGGFWAKIMMGTNSSTEVDRATYHATTWLSTFGILAGAWIWLLIKTVYYCRHDGNASDRPA